ncbi:DUF4266 domain-containing protein [Marinigracilibium pacificum]|uniref:DUF4266 domain-containing protein n=1 Tax=Marinigracilibium pacificum TaxID=2729599 RepID=A0A848IVE3_9BACT|nr:DUF4266 domain-containing protein [Marinigracilibium pacificum]NMM47656.1 DUF4266 domain-containing protein [Marinigracilibium pacificum]
MKVKRLLFFVISLLWLQSCVSVKPYEQIYINDPDMQMGSDSGDNFQKYVHSIREGATPAGSTKGSGGCGCN